MDGLATMVLRKQVVQQKGSNSATLENTAEINDELYQRFKQVK